MTPDADMPGASPPLLPQAGDAPLIVTLGFNAEAFRRLDDLRRAHFPPERNVVPAHLTLFHAMPGAQARLVRETLRAEAARHGPLPCRIVGPKALGRGVALGVEAAALSALRDRLADAFLPFLTPQDRQGFRPHVTIQNKVDPKEAAALLKSLKATFMPFEAVGEALLLWRYRGGPWEAAARFPFRR